MGRRLIVFVAEGFGSGRMRFAPGTWGSLVGIAWTCLLLASGSLAVYLAGIVLGFFASVCIGGRAEEILALKDPGRIVIDEITALPLAYLGAAMVFGMGSLFGPLAGRHAIALAAAFALFRLFDVLKPLGIARAQHLPGGWGLTVDDFLAAAVVCPIISVFAFLLR